MFSKLIKLRYCEKATTSFDINVKISGRFFLIFVAFSKNMDKRNITSKSMFCKALIAISLCNQIILNVM